MYDRSRHARTGPPLLVRRRVPPRPCWQVPPSPETPRTLSVVSQTPAPLPDAAQCAAHRPTGFRSSRTVVARPAAPARRTGRAITEHGAPSTSPERHGAIRACAMRQRQPRPSTLRRGDQRVVARRACVRAGSMQISRPRACMGEACGSVGRCRRCRERGAHARVGDHGATHPQRQEMAAGMLTGPELARLVSTRARVLSTCPRVSSSSSSMRNAAPRRPWRCRPQSAPQPTPLAENRPPVSASSPRPQAPTR